jgi:CTP:molybdopterin cytidylyltransferase MocA
VKFGAVIAAAGLSSRMGAFKPLLPLGNRTVIEQIIHTLRAGPVEDIAVVTGRDAALIEQALADYAVTFIHNKDYANTDMFYSASLGLAWMSEQVDCIFFTPVDIPLFQTDTVRLLAEHMLNSGGHIAIPFYNDTGGHPVAIRSTAVKELIAYKAGGGLRGAINAYRGPCGFIPVNDSGILYDLDTKEDYRNLMLKK